MSSYTTYFPSCYSSSTYPSIVPCLAERTVGPQPLTLLQLGWERAPENSLKNNFNIFGLQACVNAITKINLKRIVFFYV